MNSRRHDIARSVFQLSPLWLATVMTIACFLGCDRNAADQCRERGYQNGLATLDRFVSETKQRRSGTFGTYLIPMQGDGLKYWDSYAIPKWNSAKDWLSARAPTASIPPHPMLAFLWRFPDGTHIFRVEWLESEFDIDGFRLVQGNRMVACYDHVHQPSSEERAAKQRMCYIFRGAVFHLIFAGEHSTGQYNPLWERELFIDHSLEDGKLDLFLRASNGNEVGPIDVYRFESRTPIGDIRGSP